jgi:hypothetical protein
MVTAVLRSGSTPMPVTSLRAEILVADHTLAKVGE